MTNRDTLYRYLSTLDLKPLFIHNKHGYHTEFRVPLSHDLCQVLTDWGYVMGVSSIHLFAKEVMLESQYGDMEINIKYKFIERFKVEVFDEI